MVEEEHKDENLTAKCVGHDAIHMHYLQFLPTNLDKIMNEIGEMKLWMKQFETLLLKN